MSAKALLACAAACSAVAAPAQLYAPNVHPSGPSAFIGSSPTRVTVTTEDGLRLAGLWWPGRSDLPTLVFYQGRSGDQNDAAHYAEPLARAGYPLLVASYRGYGGNPGAPDEAGLERDAAAFLNFARSTGAKHVVLLGHSLGAAVALATAARGIGPDDAVVCVGAFAELRDAAPKLLRPLLGHAWSNTSEAAKLRAPVLFIRGRYDQTADERQSRRLLEAAPAGSLLVVLDKQDHRPDMSLIAELLPASLSALKGDLNSLVVEARARTFAIFRGDPTSPRQ